MYSQKSFAGALNLSAVAAAMLLVSACGGSDVVPPTAAAVAAADLTAKNTALATAVTAAVTTGTVVTVVDGYASGCTVTSGTLTALATGGLGQYIFAGKPTSAVRATGCVDAHTGITLPTLTAPAPTTTAGALDQVNVTPVTTMVQSYVTAGSSLGGAQMAVAALLKLSETDIFLDPVVLATTSPSAGLALQKAANQIVSVAAQVAVANTAGSGAALDPIAAFSNSARTAGSTATLVTAAQASVPATIQAAVAAAVTNVTQAIATAANVTDVARITKAASTSTAANLATLPAVNSAAATQTVTASGLTTTAVTASNIASVAQTIATQVLALVAKGDAASVALVTSTVPSAAAEVTNVVKAIEQVKVTGGLTGAGV